MPTPRWVSAAGRKGDESFAVNALEGADARRADVVRVEEVGPADWLAVDAFRAYANGDADAALQRIASNALLAQAFGDGRTAWRCREVQVSALCSMGRLDDAVALAEELMAHYESTDQPAARLQVLGQLIMVRFARGEFERALDELTSALVGLSRLHRADRASASAFLTVANAASSAEMFELASAYLRRCADPARGGYGPFVRPMIDGTIARNESRWAARLELIGRPEEAAARYREALRAAVRAQAAHRAGHWQRVGRLYEGLAWTALGEPEVGRGALLQALGCERHALEPEDNLVLHLALARCCTDLGATAEARRHLAVAAALPDPTFSRQWRVTALSQAAELERVDHGDHPALEASRQAATLLAQGLWEERERRLEAVMVRMQMLELAEENERVGQAATEDALTGLGNRRRLDLAIRELSAADAAACLLFVDLDNFKATNDTFSHAIGDEVLKRLAVILREECREGDIVTRYGGDEFVLVLLGAPLRTGTRVAERIRGAVANHPWSHLAPGLAARVSIGVAEHRTGMSFEQVMAAADAALYVAKERGRDRVAVA